MRWAEVVAVGLAVAAGVLFTETVVVWSFEAHYLAALRDEWIWLGFLAAYALVFVPLALVGAGLARLLGGRDPAAAPDLDTLLASALVALPLLGAPFAFRRALGALLDGPLGVLLAIVVVGGLVGLALWARSRTPGLRRWLLAASVAALFALAAVEPNALHQLPSQLLTAGGLAALFASALIGLALALPLLWAVLRADGARRVGRVVGCAAGYAGGLALLVHLGGVPANGQEMPVAEDSPSVVLVVMDTLRADFVGLDEGESLTPNLREFARQAVVFERSYSVAPWTTPSFGSLFSSQYPADHDAGRIDPQLGYKHAMRDDVTSLAEVLSERGFWTGAALTNPSVSQRYKLDQGFRYYENLLAPHWYHPVAYLLNRPWVRDWLPTGKWMRGRRSYVLGPSQARRALEMIDRADAVGSPFLVLAHFMDAHIPYDAPDRFYQSPSERDTLRGRYTAEVRFADHAFGGFVQALRDRGLYDDLMIVVTADHGEELDENRLGYHRDHGHTLFEELIRVPLMVKPPGHAGPMQLRQDLASSVDVAPTILGRLGIEAPAEWRGRDLLASEAPDRTVISESLLIGPERKAAMAGANKLVVPAERLVRSESRYVDLEDDPLERSPVGFASANGRAEPLFRRIEEHVAGEREPEAGGAPVEIDDALQSQLEALGYVDN